MKIYTYTYTIPLWHSQPTLWEHICVTSYTNKQTNKQTNKKINTTDNSTDTATATTTRINATAIPHPHKIDSCILYSSQCIPCHSKFPTSKSSLVIAKKPCHCRIKLIVVFATAIPHPHILIVVSITSYPLTPTQVQHYQDYYYHPQPIIATQILALLHCLCPIFQPLSINSWLLSRV